MELKDKQELHQKFFDKTEIYKATTFNNFSGHDDKVDFYSINDDVSISYHTKKTTGFDKSKSYITGTCYNLPLESIYFKNLNEAIDICIVSDILSKELTTRKRITPRKLKLLSRFKRNEQKILEYASILALREKYNEFLNTRLTITDFNKGENIKDDLEEFKVNDYIPEDQYNDVIDGLVQEKENIKNYKQTAEYYINKLDAEIKNSKYSAKQAQKQVSQDGYCVGYDDGMGGYEEEYEDEDIDPTLYCKHCKYKNHDLEK